MSEETRDLIENEASEHKYFHQMLNMAEDDLDPYQYRLLAHYVRWSNLKRKKAEGYKLTAKRCQMSPKMVLKARQYLIDNGWIKHIAPTPEQANRGIGGVVVIVDRWRENFDRYDDKPGSLVDQVGAKPGSLVDQKKESSTGKKEDKNLSSLKNATGVNSNSSVKEGPNPQTAKTNNTPNPPPARAPLPRQRDPIFDAVAEYIFGVSDPTIRLTMQPDETPEGKKQRKTTNTRISIIKSWLKREIEYIPYGKSSKQVGFISGPATVDQIKQFAAWYKAKTKDQISMVLDGEKFVDTWRKWASEVNARQQRLAPRPQPAAPTAQPLTDDQRKQRQAELAAQRNGASA
jgi:hypothetical protein